MHLPDRQLVDQSDDRFAGAVDDVELDLDADPPVVAALISGLEWIAAARIAEIDTAVKIVARLGQVWYLPWTDVDEITENTVTLRSARADLLPLEEMARY